MSEKVKPTPAEQRCVAYRVANMRRDGAYQRADDSYYVAIGKAEADYKRRTE